MSGIKDLFGDTPFELRRSYPDTPGHVSEQTSIDAAKSIEGGAETLRQRCHEYIRDAGSATCDEVEVALNMRHQTASARLRELFLAGRIKKTGGVRKTRSGRLAFVYVIEDRT